jgi:hypothetical protein
LGAWPGGSCRWLLLLLLLPEWLLPRLGWLLSWTDLLSGVLVVVLTWVLHLLLG